jgi:hypothetical protein
VEPDYVLPLNSGRNRFIESTPGRVIQRQRRQQEEGGAERVEGAVDQVFRVAGQAEGLERGEKVETSGSGDRTKAQSPGASTRDLCYDFLNIFTDKFWRKFWRFWLRLLLFFAKN